MSKKANSAEGCMPLNDLVKRRKSEVRYCERLSNGQLLNVYFWRSPENLEAYGWMNGWKVGVIICEHRKQANHWYQKEAAKENGALTGKCGLEGLRRAQDIILDFRYRLKVNEMLFVSFSDQKRAKAYRRLLNQGFEEFYIDDEFKAYGALNPLYWIQPKEDLDDNEKT